MNDENEQKLSSMLDRLSFQVHEERSCVTVKGFALELGIKRMEAIPLFRQFLLNSQADSNKKYLVTQYRMKSHTVTLETTTFDHETTCSKIGSNLYSIVLHDTNTRTTPIQTLERDYAIWNDNPESLNDSSIHCDLIQPSPHRQQHTITTPACSHHETKSNGLPSPSIPSKPKSSIATTTVCSSNNNKKVMKPKETTAASFFAPKNSNNASKPKISPASTTKDSSSFTTKTATKKTKRKQINVDDDNYDDNDDIEEKDNAPSKSKSVKVAKKDIEKNNNNTSSQKDKEQALSQQEEEEEEGNEEEKKMGNADDFIGDIDEDEDFLKEETKRKERNASIRRQEVRDYATNHSKVMEAKMERRKQEKHLPKSGEQLKQQSKKKRKRVLVEKTVEDADGYLQTKLVHEWQDVEDEEEKENPPQPKKPTINKPKSKFKNSSNMKQAGLMNFFARKS